MVVRLLDILCIRDLDFVKYTVFTEKIVIEEEDRRNTILSTESFLLINEEEVFSIGPMKREIGESANQTKDKRK